uniref:Uncharacterized protein n=1 Tax=Mesocestoides corti TaxID=53468 RepID=A0A5K3FJ34_MESCO
MDSLCGPIQKEITIIDEKIRFINHARNLPVLKKIEFCRQLRVKNDLVLKSLKEKLERFPGNQQNPPNKIKNLNFRILYNRKDIKPHPRCERFREEYIKEKEREELKEAIELSKCGRFKARPPPSHVYLNLYSKMVSEEWSRKTTKKERTVSVSKRC